MAFKAYQPPAEQGLDWTDNLTTKYLPAIGTAAGGIIGGVYGGPGGAVAGAQLGNAAGTAIGGLASNKKGSDIQTQAGLTSGIKAGSQFPWRPDLGTPQVGAQPQQATAAMPDEKDKIQSYYAQRRMG